MSKKEQQAHDIRTLPHDIRTLRRRASMERKGLEIKRRRASELGAEFEETKTKIDILTSFLDTLKRNHAEAEKEVSSLLESVVFTELSINQLETIGYDGLTVEAKGQRV